MNFKLSLFSSFLYTMILQLFLFHPNKINKITLIYKYLAREFLSLVHPANVKQATQLGANRFRQNYLSTVGNVPTPALHRHKFQVCQRRQRIRAFSTSESNGGLERIVEPVARLLFVNLQREWSRVKCDVRRFRCSLPRERLARPPKIIQRR